MTSKTNIPQINQNAKNLRASTPVFTILFGAIIVLLCVALCIGGTISFISTGTWAFILVPLVFIVSALLLFLGIKYVLFIATIIDAYTDTVENIQLLTAIAVMEYNSKCNIENTNSDTTM